MGTRINTNLKVDRSRVEQFCQRWKVVELALFGSILRDDFGPSSDVDVLVTFAPEASWSLLEWADMIDELEAIFGRSVDLVEKGGLRNPFRRRTILSTAEVVYAAA
jgi:uncharacterized protein